MKNFQKNFMAVVLFLTLAMPLAWSAQQDPMSASKADAEYMDLQSNIKKDRIAEVVQQVKDLQRENRFLSDRIKLLERRVDDLQDRLQ